MIKHLGENSFFFMLLVIDNRLQKSNQNTLKHWTSQVWLLLSSMQVTDVTILQPPQTFRLKWQILQGLPGNWPHHPSVYGYIYIWFHACKQLRSMFGIWSWQILECQVFWWQVTFSAHASMTSSSSRSASYRSLSIMGTLGKSWVWCSFTRHSNPPSRYFWAFLLLWQNCG